VAEASLDEFLNMAPAELKKVEKLRPDVAVHLGWGGIPNFDWNTSLMNSIGSLRFARACFHLGIPRMVVAGSNQEYGRLGGSVSEDQEPHPSTAFACSKVALSEWLAGFEVERPSSVVWARIFFVYGAGQRSKALLPSVLTHLSRGLLFSPTNPDSVIDMIHVRDVVSCLLTLCNPSARGGVYNVGSGVPHKVSDVVGAVSRMWEGSPGIKISPTYDHLQGMWADLRKLLKTEGYRPATPLEVGLKLEVENFKVSRR
jgi:dTDP-6-deoxy-L-talose 4-dehydrogenase (NAD+)